MHAPLSDHPAAWLGHELACREDWRQSWSDDELAAIREVARHMPGTRVRDSSASDREAAVHLLRAGAAAERMGRIQHSLEHGSGAVWLQGLPADEFSLPQLEWIFWALASLVGTPVSQSAAGERVFHVRDERFGEQDA
ncbi:MAG: hypothetical protein KDB14_34895, partial [Planctomycetales bacterium]|nr:hypothetical protein [Planctomycetales bacterium]